MKVWIFSNLTTSMPQPFTTKVKFGTQYHITSGLENRPDLAIAFGEAMEEFAVCEGCLGSLYLILNINNIEKSYEELSKNVNFSKRIFMIKNSIQLYGKEDRALILAVTDRAETASNMRNKIAHCFWGYSPTFPNLVIQTPTSKTLKKTYDKIRKLLDNSVKFESNETDLMVYNIRDFQDIKNAATNAIVPLELLKNYMMADELERDNLKTVILSNPQTQTRYEKRISENYNSKNWFRLFLKRIEKF